MLSSFYKTLSLYRGRFTCYPPSIKPCHYRGRFTCYPPSIKPCHYRGRFTCYPPSIKPCHYRGRFTCYPPSIKPCHYRGRFTSYTPYNMTRSYSFQYAISHYTYRFCHFGNRESPNLRLEALSSGESPLLVY